MKFSHEIRYDAPAAAVYSMLADPSFREEVCRAGGALAQKVTVTQDGRGTTVVVDRTMPAEGIPSFATKFVGHEIQVVQTETWTSATQATLDLAIPGKPGHMRGTIRLAEQAGTTVETVEGDLKVSIPLVGGKLEGMIADLLRAALKTEQRVGASHLAR